MMTSRQRRCTMERRTTVVFFWLTIFAFVASLGSTKATEATNPGLQFRISKTLLNYASNVAVHMLSQRAAQLRIPDRHERDGRVEYEVTNMKVSNFVQPGSSVVVNPGSGVTWILENAGLSVNGDWRYKYKRGFIKIRDHGGFEGSVASTTVSVSVVLGKDSSGRPTISSSECSCQISSLQLRVQGGGSWFYNFLIGHFENPLKTILQDLICDAAMKAVNEDARDELATLPIQVPVKDQWIMDYQLVAPPQFQSEYMDSFHKGEFIARGDPSEAPFQAYPFPVSTTQKMLTIWVSDYVLNTIGHVFHRQGLLQYSIRKSDLSGDDGTFLNTSCKMFSCIGSLVPQLKRAYPNASVEIEMSSTTAPQFNISSRDIRGKVDGQMTYRARLSNGSLAYLFKANVSLSVAVIVSLSDMVLKANVTGLSPAISVIDSGVGPISDFILQAAFKIAAKAKLLPRLREAGQKGIRIPFIRHVDFVNTELEMDNHCLRLGTDVRYSHN